MAYIPNVRFKGFTDDWEQRKYGDVIDLLSGQDFSTDAFNDLGEGIPYMTGASCIDGNQTIVNRWTMNPKCIANKGDVLVVCKGSGCGTIAILTQPEAHIARQFMALKCCKKLDSLFNFYLANSVVNEIKKDARGLITGIARDAVLKIAIKVPSMSEQKQIGAYLSSFDHLITFHQRKCDETKELKKYMLQKMFPQNGKKIPEIRFAGFTDVWKQRKIESIIEDYVEKSTVENQYPVLTSSQQKGIVLQDDYFKGDRVSQSGNVGYFIIPRGYFTYRSRSDNDLFAFNRNDCVDKGIISYFYPVFKPKDVDSDFLLRRLNNGLEAQLRTASEGTGQHVLSLKKFKCMTALFPSISEQQQIGSYFRNLDDLITLHQRKCDELKEVKKFMLQNMFPQKG